MKKILIALYIGITCLSCNNDPSSNTTTDLGDDQFLEESQIGAYLNNVALKQFDQSTEQVIFDDNKSLYVVSDINYTTHFTLSIEGNMTLGNKVEVNYINNNIEKLGEGVASMEIIKIDATDRRYWLWNNDLTLGFILDFDL